VLSCFLSLALPFPLLRFSWLLLCLLILALGRSLSCSPSVTPCLENVISTRLSFVDITAEIIFFLRSWYEKMAFSSSPVRVTLRLPSPSPRVYTVGRSLARTVTSCPNFLGLMVLPKFLTFRGWGASLAGTPSPSPLVYPLLKKREKAWGRSHFGVATGDKTKDEKSSCPQLGSPKALRDETHPRFLFFPKVTN